MWSSPAAGLRYLICPVVASGSQSARLLADGHLSTQDHSPTLAASTDIHAHTHTHTSGSPSPHPDSSGCPGPLFLPAASSSHGPTLRDTQGTNPYHLLIISSSSISPCSHILTCTSTLTAVVGTMDTQAPLICGSTPYVVPQTHTRLCTQSTPQLGKWLEMGFREKPQQTATLVQGTAKQVN